MQPAIAVRHIANLVIRPARLLDIHAITQIYAHHVLHGTGTFEIEPPDEIEMTRRREDVLSRGLPFLVASTQAAGNDAGIEPGERVIGYAYANVFRVRPAYRYCVEDSVYVAENIRGRGVGRDLLAKLLSACEAAGSRQVVAVIGDSRNTSSIALHRSLGFDDAGVLRAAGWKHGRWLDAVLMQRQLGDGALCPPEDADALPAGVGH